MKKFLSLVLVITLCGTVFCSCEKEDKGDDTKVVSNNVVIDESNPELTPEMLQSMRPQEIQVRNICQLATLQVYFNNVAKAVKPADSGILGFLQQDRRFWVEYSGSARIGIDMSKVTMTVTDNVITVKMPHAKLLGDIEVDSTSYNVDSVVVETEDVLRRKNDITAADVKKAINEANLYTTKSILDNNSLMLNAELRAKDLIEKYISRLSKYSGVNYTINFEYIEDSTQ